MAVGLKPGNGNNYRQSVKIVGVKATPRDSAVALEVGKRAQAVIFGLDWMWAPARASGPHRHRHTPD